MGFFKKSKKEAESKANSGVNGEASREVSQPDINKMWQEAYRANPRAYEKEGSVIIGFALTESTDSLFPIEPEKEWAIDGVTINQWIITVVSLTNPQGGIIGQIEYHEAVKRLAPFIVAQSGNWVLIRGMSHDELDKLFDGLGRQIV